MSALAKLQSRHENRQTDRHLNALIATLLHLPIGGELNTTAI